MKNISWTKKAWNELANKTYKTTPTLINQIDTLRKIYKTEKSKYQTVQKLTNKNIKKYLDVLFETACLTPESISEIEKVIYEKQKPLDHNGKHKDKIYLLCDNDLKWKLDKYDPDEFVLNKDPSTVKRMLPSVMGFLNKKGNYLTLRLRWKNTTGICNPCWHCDIDKPKEYVPTMKDLKELLKQNGLKRSGKKNELMERLTSNNIKFT